MTERTEGSRALIETVFRRDQRRILAVLIRDLGDLDLAEDGLQEAFAEAMRTWPVRGLPDNAPGWILTTARNRAIDRLRRAAKGEDKEKRAVGPPGRAPTDDDQVLQQILVNEEIPDERLKLIFTCCHPMLNQRDAVILTLRTVAGLTSREIASAFLVKESTLQARITRAKAKIRDAGIPYRVPEHHELPERLGTVIDVVALVYNEGYTPATDDPVRDTLRLEAMNLASVLSSQLPDEPEALGLHALLLFHEARAPGRIDAAGRLVALEDQDRSRWNHHLAEQADELLTRALRMGRPGPYQLQAAISGLHSTSPAPADTDWAEIVLLYDQLLAIAPSPTTAVGRAVAVGMAVNPTAGLAALPPPDPPLDSFHRWHAVRADLLRRDGQLDEAVDSYAEARRLAPNPAERDWLDSQIRAITD